MVLTLLQLPITFLPDPGLSNEEKIFQSAVNFTHIPVLLIA
jgi:hypothetical protein